MMTSKDLLVGALGPGALHAYEDVKRFYMRLGHQLANTLLERVGGRPAFGDEHCDGITSEGRWEFCLQGNTKNAAGNKADLSRCPGFCVQILGRPNPGWISGEEFLSRHGVNPSELETIARDVASQIGSDLRQMRMLV